MEIGVRALRDGLSRRLEEVKHGHTITVTEHGRTIARIIPIGVPTTLERLRAEGRVSSPPSGKRSLPEPLDTHGSVSDLVAEQRR